MAVDAAGNFAVTWDQGTNLACRAFSANGTPRGSQLSLVSTEPRRRSPCRALATSRSLRQGEEVVAQRFTATALPKDAAAFVVNTSLAGDQNDPAVAIDSQGNLLVVWSGSGVADNTGIFSQRYANPPAALRADEVGHNAAATLLTLAQTQPLLAEAGARWQAVGVDAAY